MANQSVVDTPALHELLCASAEALAALQADAIANNTSGMSLEEIDEEIAGARRDGAVKASAA